MNFATNLSSVMPSPTTAVAGVMLAVLGTLCHMRQRRHLLGTTLWPTWFWSLGSLCLVALCEVVVGSQSPEANATWITPLRFAAATTTFCPAMALLGAKRPQDGMWNFIVLSLWGVLVLPAAEVFFMQSGQALEVHGIRIGFLLLLLVGGLLNQLFSPFWLTAICVAIAQGLLLAEQLPGLQQPTGSGGVLVALLLLVIGAAWGGKSLPVRTECQPLDRAWLDFRDLFGTLWALRVLERMNASTLTARDNMLLSWNGFVATDHTPIVVSDEAAAPLQQALVNLLRRFVSPEWIDCRLRVDTLPSNQKASP